MIIERFDNTGSSPADTHTDGICLKHVRPADNRETNNEAKKTYASILNGGISDNLVW